MWITTKFESLMMPAWHQKAIDLCSEGKALQIAAHTAQYFYYQANVIITGTPHTPVYFLKWLSGL